MAEQPAAASDRQAAVASSMAASLAWVWLGLFAVNMVLKEASMSRYPEWAAYKKRSWGLIPFVSVPRATVERRPRSVRRSLRRFPSPSIAGAERAWAAGGSERSGYNQRLSSLHPIRNSTMRGDGFEAADDLTETAPAIDPRPIDLPLPSGST